MKITFSALILTFTLMGCDIETVPLNVATDIEFADGDISYKAKFLVKPVGDNFMFNIENIGEQEITFHANKIYFQDASMKTVGQMGSNGKFLLEGRYGRLEQVSSITIPIGKVVEVGILVALYSKPSTQFMVIKDYKEENEMLRFQVK